jgi:hypothetical protein
MKFVAGGTSVALAFGLSALAPMHAASAHVVKGAGVLISSSVVAAPALDGTVYRVE